MRVTMQVSRRSQDPIARLGLLLLCASLALATPVPPEQELAEHNNATITQRAACDGPLCGWRDQLCCGWNERCYTDYNDEAQCTPAPTPAPTGRGGHWVYYTTTWVETDRITKTKVYSRYVSAPSSVYIPPQTTQKIAICYNGDRPCGNICCQSWQHCVVEGYCGGHRPSGVPYTPPVRPTSYVTITHSQVVGPTTTTVGFEPAVTTGHHGGGGGVIVSESSGGGGLSAGAIAGIVIGVIIGLIFLILLCLILCFKSAWDALLAFFGIGTGRKRRETVEYEHYSRHGSRSGRQWHGSGRPPSQGPPPPKKKEKSGFGFGTILASLGALAIALGLKRRVDRRRRDEKSDYTASSGYYYDTSSSSDRRTRDTRRSSRR